MTITYLSEKCQSGRGKSFLWGGLESCHTKSQLDDSQDASNARHTRHPLPSSKSAITETDVATWTVDRQGRRIGSRRRPEDVRVGGDLDVDVPEGKGHGVGWS